MHLMHGWPTLCRLLQCSMEPYLGFESAFLPTKPRKGIDMLLAILKFLKAWRRYNASLRELYSLGDRELADIGITRSDIPRIAWDSANKR